MTKDGRFKQSSTIPGTIEHWRAEWSDGQNVYVSEGTKQDNLENITSRYKQDINHWSPGVNRTDFLVELSLGKLVEYRSTIRGLRQYLGSFAVNTSLSDTEFVVFERNELLTSDEHSRLIERITVNRRDNLIRKFEALRLGRVYLSIHISTATFDSALTSKDLEGEGKTPWLTEYYSNNQPAIFLAVSIVLSAIAGCFFWAAISRSRGFEEMVLIRRNSWRYFFIALVGISAILGGLAALTTVGEGGGHPHPIVIIAILGLFFANAFAAVAAFLCGGFFVRSRQSESKS